LKLEGLDKTDLAISSRRKKFLASLA